MFLPNLTVQKFHSQNKCSNSFSEYIAYLIINKNAMC